MTATIIVNIRASLAPIGMSTRRRRRVGSSDLLTRGPLFLPSWHIPDVTRFLLLHDLFFLVSPWPARFHIERHFPRLDGPDRRTWDVVRPGIHCDCPIEHLCTARGTIPPTMSSLTPGMHFRSIVISNRDSSASYFLIPSGGIASSSSESS